jgi:hypothetical protein
MREIQLKFLEPEKTESLSWEKSTYRKVASAEAARTKEETSHLKGVSRASRQEHNLRSVWEQKWKQNKESIYIGGGPCSVWRSRVNQLNKNFKDNEKQVTHCCRIYRGGKLE